MTGVSAQAEDAAAVSAYGSSLGSCAFGTDITGSGRPTLVAGLRPPNFPMPAALDGESVGLSQSVRSTTNVFCEWEKRHAV